MQIKANAIMSAWNETTLDWNNHPTTFETVGTANTVATQNNWVNFNVAAAVQEWWSGGIILNGFELQYTDETKPQEFFFSDDNTNTSDRPKLTVNYVQDTTTPSGSLSLNDGATYTNNSGGGSDARSYGYGQHPGVEQQLDQRQWGWLPWDLSGELECGWVAVSTDCRYLQLRQFDSAMRRPSSPIRSTSTMRQLSPRCSKPIRWGPQRWRGQRG